MKRKRGSREATASKRKKAESGSKTESVTHPVLSQAHASLLSLRQWLGLRFCTGSRVQQRDATCSPAITSQDDKAQDEQVSEFLDNVVVGQNDELSVSVLDRKSAFRYFSQQLHSSAVGATGSSGGLNRTTMSELVDFAMWLLFHKVYPDQLRPPHLLCHGMVRSSTTWDKGHPLAESSVPGLISVFPNKYVEDLKARPWSSILQYLGKRGDEIILNLVLDCSLYMPVDKDKGTYNQISGIALSEVSLATGAPNISSQLRAQGESTCMLNRKASEIKLLRYRMLYARAALNARGEVAFGLRHIHIFNRCKQMDRPQDAEHLLMYLFPRQYGLHNVFTFTTDPAETVQPYQDYVLREKEIDRVLRPRSGRSGASGYCHVPKRLRGEAQRLVRKLLELHQKCSYTQLLAHYCPPPPAQASSIQDCTRAEKPAFLQLATPAADVSAFCTAALRRVFPRQLIGDGEVGEHNWRALARNINLFVKLRRFETLTLDVLARDLRVKGIEWLCPPKQSPNANLSMSDLDKRRELVAELIYFIFDSFLLPLVRTNFHVTESGVYRNRLFYFRHDVWRRLTEPAITQMKHDHFEEFGNQCIFQARNKEALGYSHVRLLPKAKGLRPITNLRKRMQVVQNGRKVMAKSINTLLAPASSVLNLEKTSTNLGASLFSVSGVYPKLQSYRHSISSHKEPQRLYFTKVDVKSCFDSLPQAALLALVEDLVKSDQYSICRHAQVRPADGATGARAEAKPLKRFRSEARRGISSTPYAESGLSSGARPGSNTVFVDNIVPQKVTRTQVMQLLRQHIENNIIKVGKKYYRQKRGIAQGSVVSSLLCNLLYARMEEEYLAFIQSDSSILLRLIDDFLLITTDKAQALEFLEVMHEGVAAYGVSVTPEKSLTNFGACVNDFKVPCLPSSTHSFPYCGLMIDTRTLEISKDMTRTSKLSGADGLTVDMCRTAGSAFSRKMLMGLKIQLHTMLIDTSYNSVTAVWRNVYTVMADVANKMLHYTRCLPKRQRPSARMLSRLMDDMLKLVKGMTCPERHKSRSEHYEFEVSTAAVRCITAVAFEKVFSGRAASCPTFLGWLRSMRVEAEACLKSGEPHQARLIKSLSLT